MDRDWISLAFVPLDVLSLRECLPMAMAHGVGNGPSAWTMVWRAFCWLGCLDIPRYVCCVCDRTWIWRDVSMNATKTICSAAMVCGVVKSMELRAPVCGARLQSTVG